MTCLLLPLAAASGPWQGRAQMAKRGPLAGPMLLDRGMSGQMGVRARDGTLARYPNLRPVPLGRVVRRREGSRR